MNTGMFIRFIRWLQMCFPIGCILLPPATTSGSHFIGVPFGGGAKGNSYAWEPFALEERGLTSCRYQQVYSASEFSLLGHYGGYISAIWFHSDDKLRRGFSADLPKVEILMGTTLRNPDGLSTTFAENPTGTLSTVYSQGMLSFDASGRGGLAMITLQTPFLYNPADGNLLIEEGVTKAEVTNLDFIGDFEDSA